MQNLVQHHEPLPVPVEEARASFVRSIEACFVALRGRGVLWSPDDAARASQWYALGLSAATAVAVLQARMEAYRFVRGPTAPVPRDLRWYEPALLDACRHRLRFGATWLTEPMAMAEEQQPLQADAGGPLLALLAAVPTLREAAVHPIWQHVLGVCAQRIDAALAGEGQPQDREPQEVIMALQAQVRRLVQAGLSDAQQEAQQAFVAQGLGAAAAQLSKKARAERAKWLELQWAAVILGLRWPTLQGWIDPSAAV